jgi:hypothetical protein
MSQFNVYELSKLPKEILIKILLAKNNTSHFDLSYCYSMRDGVTNRINELKTEIIKNELIELMEDEDKAFVADITRIRISKNTSLKFKYLNFNITIRQSYINVILYKKVLYQENYGKVIELHDNKIAFVKSLKNFQNLLFSKIGIYTLFESICWFLDNDKLTLDI